MSGNTSVVRHYSDKITAHLYKYLQDYGAWLNKSVSDKDLFIYKDLIEKFKNKDETVIKSDNHELLDGQLDCIYTEIQKRGIYKADNAIYTVMKGGGTE